MHANIVFSIPFVFNLFPQVLDNEFLADRCPSLDGFQAFRNIILPNFNFNFTVGGSTTASTPTSPPTATPGVFELSIGYVRQCIINASFDYIRRFDTYRQVSLCNYLSSLKL